MNIAIIFAGGVGSRMGDTSVPKQFMKVKGKPVIIHTLQYFQESLEIDAIIVSIVEEYFDYMRELALEYDLSKVVSVVKGGETGQLSIYNGLLEAENYCVTNSISDKSIVLIHDGVRPNISVELIERNIENVKKNGSSITVSKATETFMLSSNMIDVNVADREDSYIAKAPQSFYLEDILSLHKRAMNEGINNSIDSCTLCAKFGQKLSLTVGSSENFKITTYSDYLMFNALKQGD